MTTAEKLLQLRVLAALQIQHSHEASVSGVFSNHHLLHEVPPGCAHNIRQGAGYLSSLVLDRSLPCVGVADQSRVLTH